MNSLYILLPLARRCGSLCRVGGTGILVLIASVAFLWTFRTLSAD